jgi:hypothetical protein
MDTNSENEGLPWSAKYYHTEEDWVADETPHPFWPGTGEEFQFPPTAGGGVVISGAEPATKPLPEK